MLNHQNLLLGTLGIFCLYATYTDIRERKITNLCAYGLIYAGILSQIIFILSGNTTVLKSLITVTGGFGIVFALYWFGIFAAGDAKLFWGICLLVPPNLFSAGNALAQFVPASLAINTFVPYFLIFTIYLLTTSTGGQKLRALTQIYQMEDFFKKALDMFFRLILLLGLGQVVNILFTWQGIGIDSLYSSILVLSLFFAINYLVSKLSLEKWRNYIICPVLFEIMILSTPFTLRAWSQTYLMFLKLYFIYIAVFLFLRLYIDNLDSMVLDKEIDIADLEEGMVSAEQIVKEDRDSEVAYQKTGFSLPNVLNENVVLTTLSHALSKEKIAELKQLAQDGCFQEFENKIKIQQSLCFAPIILLGVVLTVLCQGPFFLVFQ